jgi:alpha-ribazole phosphatase
MEIYLIRHTELSISKSVCYGQSEIPLADTFEKEKKRLLQKLQKIIQQYPFVYSSPSLRCLYLAECFSEKIKTDVRLQELDFGEWEMKKWEEINQEDLNIWMNDFVNQRAGDGESFIELYKRSTDFFKEILEIDIPNPVLIFTHAGVIRSLLCYVLGVPLQNAFRLSVDYGSVSKISFQQQQFTVHFINGFSL